jgi:hypothetical protein
MGLQVISRAPRTTAGSRRCWIRANASWSWAGQLLACSSSWAPIRAILVKQTLRYLQQSREAYQGHICHREKKQGINRDNSEIQNQIIFLN